MGYKILLRESPIKSPAFKLYYSLKNSKSFNDIYNSFYIKWNDNIYVKSLDLHNDINNNSYNPIYTDNKYSFKLNILYTFITSIVIYKLYKFNMYKNKCKNNDIYNEYINEYENELNKINDNMDNNKENDEVKELDE